LKSSSRIFCPRQSFFVFLGLVLSVFHQNDARSQVPVPAAQSLPKAPPGLEGLSWNKWDTDHFVVISLDKSEGSALKSQVESMRSSVVGRWGIKPNSGLNCKLVCVPDAKMLKRLFGLSEPAFEVLGSDGSGRSSCAIWFDMERSLLLPSLLAEAELSSDRSGDLARFGIPALERSPSHVREVVSSCSDADLKTFLASKDRSSEGFRRGAVVACLMVRKELGLVAFSGATGSSDPLHKSLGFGTEERLYSTLSRYRSNLVEDIRNGRTPDEYLGVKR